MVRLCPCIQLTDAIGTESNRMSNSLPRFNSIQLRHTAVFVLIPILTLSNVPVIIRGEPRPDSSQINKLVRTERQTMLPFFKRSSNTRSWVAVN